MRSSSLTGRPLTKATAPPVRFQSRASVSRSACETNTSRGVGAKSSSVPSTSSRMAILVEIGQEAIGMRFDITWSGQVVQIDGC